MSKSDPTTKEELFQFAKLRLGEPVQRVEVHDDQMEALFNEAVDLFDRYHMDATEHVYLAQLITEEDAQRNHFILPNHIVDVIRVMKNYGSLHSDQSLLWIPGGSGLGQSGWLVDSGVAGGYGNVSPGVGAYGRTNQVTIYLMAMQAAEFEALFVGESSIRFNSLTKRLDIDQSRSQMTPGRYIVCEATSSLAKRNDPAAFQSGWLRRYFTAKVKQQWGENLSKFNGNWMGTDDVTVNWQKIVSEASKDLSDLRQELETSWTAQPGFWIG